MPYLGIDPLYLLISAPAVILSLYAAVKVKSTFARYARVGVRSGLTGAQAAAALLRNAGIYDVRIEKVNGFLSDHYDPTAKVLRLSPDVYGNPSISSVGVACHEAGHAIQHARAYGPLALRTAMVPVVQFGSNFAMVFILIGALLSGVNPASGRAILMFGVMCFSAVVLFSIVTLPVEWDASARAKKLMVSTGIVSTSEVGSAASVLNAAFLTYLASAMSSLLTLLYYLFRLGIIGGGRSRD